MNTTTQSRTLRQVEKDRYEIRFDGQVIGHTYRAANGAYWALPRKGGNVGQFASMHNAAKAVAEKMLPARDFRLRDELDNSEFMTSATIDLIEFGKVVHTETFTCSSEDAYGPSLSAYGNGRDNNATTQALSYAWAWVEAEDFEAAFAPFGSAWEREQEGGR